MEVKRQLDVLDKQLEHNEFIVGAELTIADFAIYPWYGAMAARSFVRGRRFFRGRNLYAPYHAGQSSFPKRPAFKRGSIVNRVHGVRKRA